MIKCELIVEGYSYQVTNDVMNWDDVNVSLKRGDYDGVARSFSSKFEFVNTAYALLKKQYRNNYLGAAASIVISRRNNSWTWSELFRCTLDFSTYEDSGNVISINAVDDSLASIIKSKKGIQYEYIVDTIKEGKQLYYDGILLQYYADYIFGGTTLDDGTQYIEIYKAGAEPRSYSLPIEIYGSEIPPKESAIGADSVSLSMNVPRFAKSYETTNVSIDVEFDFYGSSGNIYIALSEIKEDASFIKHGEWYNQYGLTGKHTVENKTISFTINRGSVLKLSIVELAGDVGGSGNATTKVYFIKFRMKVNWDSKANPVNIDVVSPVRLLNNLLQSMNDGNQIITGEIKPGFDSRLDNCMIVAAESARDIKKAKLYSSFSKFSEWMKTEFGYVYDISDKKVTFRHRTKYFSDEIVKEVTEFEDFSYNVNPSLIYSSVRSGYDKQDYDSINGRDEFRFTNTFSTGIALTDNTLDLISPYRADAYGFEFLVQKRGKDTTDTESDNDVFFIGAKLSQDASRYELIRDGYNLSGVISPETMFNAMYSPRQMLLANIGFIGMCTGKLTYTSGEGNSEVSVNGVKEKDDILIPDSKRIATVGELAFSTPDFEIPDNRIGLVSLIRNGETYLGYIQKADMNAGHEECTKFTLSVKDIQ